MRPIVIIILFLLLFSSCNLKKCVNVTTKGYEPYRENVQGHNIIGYFKNGYIIDTQYNISGTYHNGFMVGKDEKVVGTYRNGYIFDTNDSIIATYSNGYIMRVYQ